MNMTATRPEPDQARQMLADAKMLLAEARFKEAGALAQSIYQAYPDYVPLFYFMVDLFHLLNDTKKRSAWQDIAMKADPFHPLAKVLLGRAFAENGRFAEAIAAADEVLASYPDLAEAHGLKALALMALKENEAAKPHVEKAIAEIKYDPTLYEMAAVLYFEDHDFKNAGEHAQQSLRLDKNRVNAFAIVGKSFRSLGNLDNAEIAIKEGLGVDPNSLSLKEEFLSIMMQKGRITEVKDLLEELLLLKPNDPSLKHFSAVARGENTDIAPSDYVSALFDYYAESFEEHLQEKLKYNTPRIMAEMLQAELAKRQQKPENLCLLDLGCGTGLMVSELKHIGWSGHSVGIDLSAKMVKKAKDLGRFDEAYVEDITTYMEQSAQTFDLVTCADVLVYVGALEAFFAGVRRVATDATLCAVSVEANDDSDSFVLRASGRYAHQADYVRECAAKAGLRECSMLRQILRYDGEKPIEGYLFIFAA